MSYFRSIYYKNINLLANGCQGIGFLAGKSHEDCYEYGANIAMALKVIADISDYKAGNISLWSFPALLSKSNSQDEVEESVKLHHGIERSTKLALIHIDKAILAAEKISGANELKKIAIVLTDKLKLT